jgi:hypothetical protein
MKKKLLDHFSKSFFCGTYRSPALKNLCQKPLVVEYPVCFGLLTSMVFFLLQDFWLVLSNPNNLDVKFIRNNPKACTTIIFGKG